MMASKGSLFESDRVLLVWYIQNAGSDALLKALPATIPTKETMSLVAGTVLQFYRETASILQKYLKTATDILRFAVALSDGDVSLAENTKFRAFSRPERKFILDMLNRAGNIEEDMVRYAGNWVRLGEKPHPGEYADRFPAAYQAFQKIRNDIKIETFNSKVEEALKEHDITTALRVLKTRGGELARRLDDLLRDYQDNTTEIISAFSEVAPNVSSQVLLQVMTHFRGRSHHQNNRYFFPKGNLSKIQVTPNSLVALTDEVCEVVVRVCELSLFKQFADKEPLGNVFIDPALKNVAVPLAQRTASKATKAYSRGSRFDVDAETQTIRAFIHWLNAPTGRSTTDIDLSMMLYDEDWKIVSYLSYFQIRAADGLYHSGDITNAPAPNGASEFIDMDIDIAQLLGGRYAIFVVNLFSRHKFSEVPECFFGWMERQCPNSGEIFEPQTVVSKSDLLSDSQMCIPVIFDLYDRKFIWVDMEVKANGRGANNIARNSENIGLVSRAFVEMSNPNLFDLFRLNALARGTLVEKPEDADIVFGLDERADLTPFDVEKILSDFL
jgi:hypothetical protein